MKTLTLTLAVLITFGLGCAQSPTVDSDLNARLERLERLEKETASIVTTEDIRIMTSNAKGCTQSEIAEAGDQYSYQGPLDPQIIHRDWAHILELLRGDMAMAEMAFSNPDLSSDIRSALLLIQMGSCVAFSILNGANEVQMFTYDHASGCYLKEENLENYKEIQTQLLKAAYFKGQPT